MTPLYRPRRALKIITMTAVVGAVLAACSADFGDLFTPVRVSAHEDAATVNMTVTMVAPWDDLIDDLTPAVGLDFAGAEGRALAQTSAQTSRDQRSSGIGFQAGYQNLSGGATKADEPPELKDPKDPVGKDRKAADLPGLAEIPKTFEDDPLLALTAANALFQEGKLLEAMPKYAALRPGYRAYVVRLQVGVVPYRRNLPYDVFTTISFFTNYDSPVTTGQDIANLIKAAKDAANRADDAYLAGDTAGEASERAAARTAWAEVAKKQQQAQVLPILVTDNLENTLSSRSRGDLRQITFALTAILPNIAASLSLSDIHELIRSFYGNEQNGLLTVGRVSDNSLRVRLGAPRQPTAGYAMIPRTHNITTLVLVPEDYTGNLQVVTRSEFRDVEPDGEEGRVAVLGPRHHTKEREDVARALASFGPGCRWDKTINAVASCPDFKAGSKPASSRLLSNVIQRVLFNDYPGFVATLHDAGVETRFAHDMWILVADVLSRNGFTADRVELPKITPPSLPPVQSPALVDDKSKITVRLQGGRALRPDWLSAILNVKVGDRNFALAAAGVDLRAGRHPAFVFDSIANSAGADKTDWGNSNLVVTLAPATPWADKPAGWPPGTVTAPCAAAANNDAVTCTYDRILALKPKAEKKEDAKPDEAGAGAVDKAVEGLKKAVESLEKALKAKK
tara:strand:- start:361 stop:2400 length:2040 start_codon:yes stop_codon:yes gene_type:complete